MAENSSKNGKKNPDDHSGHRKRLIEKLSVGPLLEHELLEAMLFNAMPRRNTNDIAHRLLSTFGTIQQILDAPMEELQQVKGIGESVASYLTCLGLLYRQYTEKANRVYGGKYTMKRFLSYVKEAYAGEETEVAEVYFIDEDSNIFLKKRLQRGNAGHVEIEPNSLTMLLAEYAPAGMVLVHNHPFGEAVPSEKDEQMTKKCQMLCSAQNVIFCDHVIYAPNGVYSYYLDGKMLRISTEYSVDGILGNLGFLEEV